MIDSTMKALFCGWPSDMPRRGVLLTSLNEQIPFSGFMTSENLLLLERTTPDSMGARTIIIPYENVAMVKLTDPAKVKALRGMGFEAEVPKK